MSRKKKEKRLRKKLEWLTPRLLPWQVDFVVDRLLGPTKPKKKKKSKAPRPQGLYEIRDGML